MATVTGFTASRMLGIENSSVVSGTINAAGRLQLTTRGGTTFDAGLVRDVAGIAEYENRLNQFESDVDDLGSSLSSLSGAVNGHTTKISTLETDVNTLETDVNNLEGITDNHNTRITANASSISGLTSNKLDRVNGTASGLKSDTIRLSSTTNVSISSTAHAFQIGNTTSLNLTMDDNEILARNNGAKAGLFLHDPRTMETLSFSGGQFNQLVSKQYVDNLANPQANIRYFSGSLTDVANLNTLTSGYYWIDPANVTAGKPVTFSYGFLKIEVIGSSRFATIHSVPNGYTLTASWNATSSTVYWRNVQAVVKELGAGDNLNDMTVEGIYYNHANNQATGANNYPCAYAGKLTVNRPSDRSDFIYQEYEAYGQRNGHKYTRGWYSNSWSAWRRVGGHLAGNVTITANVNTTGSAAISFPTGHFNGVPALGLGALSSGPTTTSYSYAVSTTSATIYAQRNISGAVAIGWIAMEKQE